MDDLAAAWNELQEANATLRWFTGPTTFEERVALPWPDASPPASS